MTRKTLFLLAAATLLGACGEGTSSGPVGAVGGKGGTSSSGTSLLASKTAVLTWVCENGEPRLHMVGTITITNSGAVATTGLVINDVVQWRDGTMNDWAQETTFNVATTQLAAGETRNYPYDVVVTSRDDATYRNAANITITNHSGNLGKAFGPSPKSSVSWFAAPTDLCGGGGCTLTRGYWGSHSYLGPAPTDAAWLAFNGAGTNALFNNTMVVNTVTVPMDWATGFKQPANNYYFQVAAQYMSAWLNTNVGTAIGDAAVVAAMADAVELLSGSNTLTSSATATSGQTASQIVNTLTTFNEGGPDKSNHCGT
jgi:hypothetical protein